MEWTRAGLEAAGFSGFCRFDELVQYAAPQVAGVYAVVRVSVDPPQFLPTSVAGHLKDRDPSVVPELLAEAWIDGAAVLYIGKASSGGSGRRGLRTRLHEYRRHGAGERVPHWGGRYIWQLQDSADLLVAWKPALATEDAEDIESRLIASFVANYGKRPFANRKAGRSIQAAPSALAAP